VVEPGEPGQTKRISRLLEFARGHAKILDFGLAASESAMVSSSLLDEGRVVSINAMLRQPSPAMTAMSSAFIDLILAGT
jgi:hypothetical protein